MKQLQTELNDRTLRFDGVSILKSERVFDALIRGVHPSKIRVQSIEIGDEVDQFNRMTAEDVHLREAADEPISLSMAWRLPEQYLNMNLRETIIARSVDRLIKLNYSDDVQLKASERIQAEYEQIEQRGMIEFMKTIIYVLDTFRAKNIVWGVGRGSSCACYILFILGLHAVDCVLLDVPMSEFFHD